MTPRLSKQALDYLGEIEEALLLPHACGSSHKKLQEIITKFKNSDPTINDPLKEAGKILRILGKYSYLQNTGNVETADAFYELFHKLFNLVSVSAFLEK